VRSDPATAHLQTASAVIEGDPATSGFAYAKEERAMLDPQLLEILVCPKCKGELEYRESDKELVCHGCRLRYEIRDDIPIMLIDEARPL